MEKKTNCEKCELELKDTLRYCEEHRFHIMNAYPRGSVRDYLRREGLLWSDVDAICKLIPNNHIEGTGGNITYS